MKRVLISSIQWYQRSFSAFTPAHCRYIPTCSAYTIEAIEQFGAWRGSLMGGARILRCQPFIKGGFDPVPATFSLRRNPIAKEGK
ncbi:membrane protein insertion efficiency factor YidD [Lactobacillus sp. CBA3606]|uniref:membrane protein insertion efficiency factor YidD n=1 Tax=Lactobacillus sp. CBA3606 TaxID=2099789 RepID=UPI000CFA849B|nr:membrane protein insertion efficiency factor YidD [Lactobacillus sp. CBA3606]AVK63405.1 membrane protein insertion efficiency factor YidD [Lactobacillus sp. CBA3606]